MKTAYFIFFLVFTSVHAMAEQVDPRVSEVKGLLAKLTKGSGLLGKSAPHIGVIDSWSIEVTSYTADVIPEAQLEQLYKETCAKVEKVWGVKLKSYKSTKRGSRIAVLEVPFGSEKVQSLIVMLGRGNDSYSYTFYTSEKKVSYKGVKGIVEMEHWKMSSEEVKNKP